jgi:Ca2+-binding EF-hand superfamily protein
MGGFGPPMAGFAGGIGGRQPPSFSTADADGSGGISLEEFKSAGPKPPGGNSGRIGGAGGADQLFGKMDSDGDGSVTETEFSDFQGKFSSDMQSAMLAMQEAMGGMPPIGMMRGGGGGGGGSAGSGGDLTALFDAIDTDGSGGVSRSEFSTASASQETDESGSATKLFEAIDSDADGSITASEADTFAARLADQLRQALESQQGQDGSAAFRQAAGQASEAYGAATGRSSDLAATLLKYLEAA